MRALDTNVLVRYLVNDDPAQAAVADRVLDDCRRKREPVFLSILVLCEMVWVLASSFGQSKSEIVAVLERILDLDLFRVEHEPLVRRSLEHFRRGKGNFADYLIGEIGNEAGCRDTVTFDRALKDAPGFQIL
jgi:predicted nucleic-acid-binding protein